MKATAFVRNYFTVDQAQATVDNAICAPPLLPPNLPSPPFAPALAPANLFLFESLSRDLSLSLAVSGSRLGSACVPGLFLSL